MPIFAFRDLLAAAERVACGFEGAVTNQQGTTPGDSSLTRNLVLCLDVAFAGSLGSEQQADLLLLGQHVISTNLGNETKGLNLVGIRYSSGEGYCHH